MAYATLRLDTRVVLVTTNGAVPVVVFDINCGVVMLADANTCAVPKLPTLLLPVPLTLPTNVVAVSPPFAKLALNAVLDANG